MIDKYKIEHDLVEIKKDGYRAFYYSRPRQQETIYDIHTIVDPYGYVLSASYRHDRAKSEEGILEGIYRQIRWDQENRRDKARQEHVNKYLKKKEAPTKVVSKDYPPVWKDPNVFFPLIGLVFIASFGIAMFFILCWATK